MITCNDLNNAFMLDELLDRLQHDREIIRIILQQFLSDTPRQIQELQAAIGRNDRETLRIVAHTLKGASATVSAAGLSRLAAESEDAAKSGVLEVAHESVGKLPEAYRCFVLAVERTGFLPDGFSHNLEDLVS